MKRIYGSVLVKETNSGVPNLVVVAYDSEKTMQEIISNHKEGSFTPQFIEKLGKRMGSVLTDSDGKFEVNSELLDFQGNESRPDLLLVILAPEDVIDEKHPFPLPPEKRILYISSVSRTDAGAEEAYIIRLRQSQLDHHKIKVTSTQDETNGDQFVSSINLAWRFKENMREQLQPYIRKQYDEVKKIKDEAKHKFRNLTAIPKHQREHRHLLIDPEKLRSIHKLAITDGLNGKGFKKLNDGTSSLTFNVTQSEWDLLNVNAEEGLDPAQLYEFINAKMGGLDLICKGTKSIEEIKAQYQL